MKLLFENWREFLIERATYISSLQQAYQVLGLEPGASESEAKKAYRAIARKVHPDVNPSPEARETFAKASEAYEAITFKGPGSFPYKRGGAGGPAGGTDIASMWKNTGPEGMSVLASIRQIMNIVSQAIETNQSVKVAGISVPAKLIIDRNDYSNLLNFMRNYQYEYLRGMMGAQDFVNNKILNTLKTVSISPKFGSGKQDLQNFVDVMKRIVPAEETKKEPTAADTPKPKTTASQKTKSADIPPEDIEMMRNMGIL